jgi:competence protein ComEC
MIFKQIISHLDCNIQLKQRLNWLFIVDLIPISLGAGIIVALFANQALVWCASFAMFFILIANKKHSKKAGFYKILILLFIELLGFLRAHDYIVNNKTITLDKKYNFVKLQAEIESVEAVESGKYRLILRDVKNLTSQTLPICAQSNRELLKNTHKDNPTPQLTKWVRNNCDYDKKSGNVDWKNLRLRLSVRSKTLLKTGDIVQMRANIFPPSRPAIAGAANFARYFYIKNIGGVGYSLGYLDILQRNKVVSNLRLSNLRSHIDATLLENIAQPQSGIAIALITGGRAAISRNINQAMQIAGITHILSISGMHMTIVCGLVYFILRLVLASIPTLALNHPIKQYAAIFGLLSGAFYLALADFPIPAVRSYTMIGLMFLAIILFRAADAFRSLILAAILLLLYNPLNILDLGFQLSFIATYGLIIAYRRVSRFNAKLRASGVNWLIRIGVYLGNIIFSSLVAGAITAPFVLFHFGIFSSYSILGNMLTLPLISFIIMPALVLGLLLVSLDFTGFGLAHFCLQIADIGLQWVIASAEWISRLPKSSIHWNDMSISALSIMFIGVLLMLYAWRWRIFMVGCLIMAVSWLLISERPVPHLMIAEDGSAVAVLLKEGEWLLLKGDLSNFFVKQWNDVTGGNYIPYHKNFPPVDAADDNFICDAKGCDGTLSGLKLRLRFDYRDDAPLCLADTDISIATFYARSNYKAGECAYAKLRIERDLLERVGSNIIKINTDGSFQTWNSCLEKSIFMRCN